MLPYIQVSTSASYEVKGSPVITKDGYAVAMATANKPGTSSEYLLPLHRPKRALEALTSGEPIVRGTIQSNWLSQSRAECIAAGLDVENLQKYCLGGGGLLRASQILKEGSSDGQIFEADLLLQAGEQIAPSLASLEDAIDAAVGSYMKLDVWRQGEIHSVRLDVKDLSSLVPNQILEYADCVLEDLPYKVALEEDLPLAGVFMSKGRLPLGCCEPGNVLLESFNGRPTPNLEAFIQVARELPGK